MKGDNIAQLIHHCADSHMNAFIRGKLALTEDNLTIKPYFEDEWAKLKDGEAEVVDIEYSSSNFKWATCSLESFFSALSAQEFKKTFFHLEKQSVVSLKAFLQIYAWHFLHHLAHIELAFHTPVE